MKMKKSVLAEALRVLGRVVSQTSPEVVLRSVRFAGNGDRVWLSATDGVEVVVWEVEAEFEGMVDFSVEYKALRELVRGTRGREVEVIGEKVEWPEVAVPPAEAKSVVLPENFAGLLTEAAQIVNRQEARIPLRGIHLCPDGIVVTDGKQLLHLPVAWMLDAPLTLPFPLALLTAKPEGVGSLIHWEEKGSTVFKIEIGSFVWIGRALPGVYPNWKQVIPEPSALNYAITFTPEQSTELVEFLKTVPDHPPFHAIELNVVSDGVEVIPVDFPERVLKLKAEFTGMHPREVLALNKFILLRILQQGYTVFKANPEGGIPAVATGGHGNFLAMPIRVFPQSKPKKEVKRMETVKQIETKEEPGNPLDELNQGIDEFRGKLKLLLDESVVLTRKVKEIALEQKQKEREFVQARRAIERIKMAI
ncbi:hypothetical protein SDC9_95974 [bioreactor metagenome]|uniref:Uncharacterized protein n=1 Tax=bioreactor metagenome TaxID=1076179 RepID=A0A645A8J7_9ZZZZ